VEELKAKIEGLGSVGAVSQLREMLDSKVDEVERLKAEGSIKDQELKKLQEAYAEEIKLHTEDVTKGQRALEENEQLRMMENERIRAAQAESEKAAAEALALVEELKNKPPPEPAVVAEPEVVEPEKKKKKKKKGKKGKKGKKAKKVM